jgi:multidrug efflux pump subunit AcrA (membrane-fusion protein)
MHKVILPVILVTVLFMACRTGIKIQEEEKTEARTPVILTSVSVGKMTDTVHLNATSAFLVKSSVKSTLTGYLEEVMTSLGSPISEGQPLFRIRSKEAATLKNALSTIDTSFHFVGMVTVFSPADGYITQLNYQQGDYVQDGETLASVSNRGSLVFLLDLPYELKPYLRYNKEVELKLPDGSGISGNLTSPMPFVDPESQTQRYIIRLKKPGPVPENLIASVNFILFSKEDAISLPREAILTNEQQTEFWIMKMKDTVYAVKVPVKKGIETVNRVEILSPRLAPGDQILLSGNYGLPDTARVTVQK